MTLRTPLAAALFAASLYAQNGADPKTLQFEVASFKPATPGQQGGQISPRQGNKTYAGTNMTLRQYMSVAYQVRDSQIVGGPSWLDNDRFDFQGQAEKPSTPDELHTMLQHLIEERFQMKLHKEAREKSGFALVVDKDGPKGLTKHDPEDKVYSPIRGAGRGKLAATNADMQLLTLNLSRILDSPVVDKTGLAGRFDFTLEFPIPDNDGAAPAPPGPPDPSIITKGLRDSLGLRLEGTKASAEFVVIDHIEKLTAN
jgi:uncharacterized protein (TIGR03435 family)